MYREARALRVLLDEVNANAPHRSTASDGWIGDAAHASRDSDHNPWVKVDGIGVVRARDFTHDPFHDLDCQQLADHLAARLRKHPALRSGAYVIWRRRIISADRIHEGWRPYAGSNPHETHLHLSVALAPADFDSTHPWGWHEEEDVALSNDDREWIAAQVDRAAAQAAREVMGAKVIARKDITVRQVLRELLASDAPRTSLRAPRTRPETKGSRVKEREQ